MSVTSTPLRNVTLWTTLGNWFSPFSRRQVLAAAIASLNTISRAVSCDSAPFRYRQNRPVGRAQGILVGHFWRAVKPSNPCSLTLRTKLVGRSCCLSPHDFNNEAPASHTRRCED